MSQQPPYQPPVPPRDEPARLPSEPGQPARPAFEPSPAPPVADHTAGEAVTAAEPLIREEIGQPAAVEPVRPPYPPISSWPPAPAPAAATPAAWPAATQVVLAPEPARDPTADYADGLRPGAGVPFVEGPAASVVAPVEAQRINTFFGVGAVLLLVLTIVVVILLAIFVISLLRVN